MADLVSVDFNSKFPVNGRDLHMKLEVKTSFKDWMPRMIEYGFEEGKDFSAFLSESTGGRPAKDYQLTDDMAKHICMIQRSEIGKKIRQYFIEAENQWNSPEAVFSRALKYADETIAKLNNKVAELLPKATAYDAVMETFDSVSYRDFCNKIRDTFGVKESEVRDYLVEHRLIYKVNDFNGKSRYKPYKETIDRGLIIVKDTPCSDGRVRPCNYFTYKGQQMLIDHFAPTVELDTPA